MAIILCRSLGRRATILIAAICFIVGIALCAGAEHVAMLIVGRLLLGFGVGFANQVGSSVLHGTLNTAIQGAGCKWVHMRSVISHSSSRLS